MPTHQRLSSLPSAVHPPLPDTGRPLPQSLGLPLGPGPPVGVVHGRVLQQRREHKHKTHDQVDVNSLHVGNPGQGGSNPIADGGHREHCRDAWIQGEQRKRRVSAVKGQRREEGSFCG
ncbi:hypothetical protein PoB_005212900 [Plakobranchus ocellatus]|uniref:Uncharacterized protein n=1 Tax=Plakobranchus ocellatus TaxID=259542 RepID=A0AAV4BZF4_9GAST|nr:hypothetical protein PoB_005212900 [Plakobranchus ocellatus]